MNNCWYLKMISSWFKATKILAYYAFVVLPLFYQTSDKKPHCTKGKGEKFLTGFGTWSSGSSDLLSESAEAGQKSLLLLFKGKTRAVKSSLDVESERWKILQNFGFVELAEVMEVLG